MYLRFFFSLGLLVAAGPICAASEGRFSNPIVIHEPAEGLRAFEFADLNGDGRADLVVATRRSIKVYAQREDALTFEATPWIDLPFEAPLQIAVGDFLGSGRPDLVVVQKGKLTLLHGADGWRTRQEASNGNLGSLDDPLWVGKLVPGEPWLNFISGPVWVRWSEATGFQNGYFHGPSHNDNTASRVAALSGGEAKDIVFQGPEELRIYNAPFLSLKVKPADLRESVLLPAGRALLRGSLAVGDFNGDGRPDLLASSIVGTESEMNALLIWYQGEPLGFASPPSQAISGMAGQTAVADFDGNGLDDLALLQPGRKGRLLVLFQEKGTPFPTHREALKARGHLLRVADLNGDGVPDLAVGSMGDEGSRITVFPNHSSSQK